MGKRSFYLYFLLNIAIFDAKHDVLLLALVEAWHVSSICQVMISSHRRLV